MNRLSTRCIIDMVKMFGGVPADTSNTDIDLNLVPYGLIVPKSVPQYVRDIIKGEFGLSIKEFKASLFKKPSTVKNITEEEYYTYQILHYLGTYCEDEYIKNALKSFEVPELTKEEEEELKTKLEQVDKKIRVIKVLSKEDIARAFSDLFSKNVGISEETVYTFIDYAYENDIEISVSNMKNRYALCVLIDKGMKKVSDIDEYMNYLSYSLFGIPYIKNKHFYNALNSRLKIATQFVCRHLDGKNIFKNLKDLIERDIKEFSKHTNRHRKTLLILRNHADKDLRKLLNKVLKDTKKNAVPRHAPIINRMFDESVPLQVREQVLANQDIFGLSKLYEACMLREADLSALVYKIRNGKMFIKETTNDRKDIKDIKGIVERLLTEKVRDIFGNKLQENERYFIPEYIDYAIPKSLKTLVGALPEQTKISVSVGDNFSLGVIWDREADVDIHLQDMNGRHFGWNAQSRGAGIMYSGDMTRLNKDGYAAEYFDFKGIEEFKGLFDMNLFHSQTMKDMYVKLVISSQCNKNIESFVKSNILLSTNIPVPTDRECQFFNAFLNKENDKIEMYLTNARLSQDRIPNKALNDLFLEEAKKRMSLRPYLKDFFKKANIPFDEVRSEDVSYIDLSPENINVKDMFC